VLLSISRFLMLFHWLYILAECKNRKSRTFTTCAFFTIDLSPCNIAFVRAGDSGTLVLLDFGLDLSGKPLNCKPWTEVCPSSTRGFIAPELCDPTCLWKRCSHQIDVYSVGAVIVFQVFFGRADLFHFVHHASLLVSDICPLEDASAMVNKQ